MTKTLTQFIAEATFYHGSPDLRGIRANGFEHRTHTVRNFDTKEDETVPKPVFFTSQYATARTYANDHRAFDYQNAVPGIHTAEISTHDAWTIHAQGAKFNDITYDAVKMSIPEEQHAEFDQLAKRYNHLHHKNIISTDTLATIGHKMGYAKVHIRGVRDDYSVKRKGSTNVMAVFPEHLK